MDTTSELHRLYRLERDRRKCRLTASGLQRQVRIREEMQAIITRLDAAGVPIPAEFRMDFHHSQRVSTWQTTIRI